MDISLPALKSPTDVLAVVPYLLGFSPERSAVVMGLRSRRLVFQARCDLPPADGVDAVVGHMAAVVARQRIDAALIVGYGPELDVTPTVDALRKAIEARRIKVLDALRAADGRYWSYLCNRPECCPPSGTPYDASTTLVAATATYAGFSPAASRADLVARLAPVSGSLRVAMRAAALRADERLAALIEDAPASDFQDLESDPIYLAGIAAVDRANACVGMIAPLDDDALAWLARLLVSVPVRDYAWERVGRDIEASIALWTDVVRRVEPELAAAPATLLAFAAWRHGDGASASIALDRALDADPSYSMARLLADAIDHGIPPSAWLDVPASPVRATARRRRSNGRRRTARAAPRSGRT
ncbi:MAG TPA: DUF4192 domain-containing protein [Micromonosporaceae bacterium]